MPENNKAPQHSAQDAARPCVVTLTFDPSTRTVAIECTGGPPLFALGILEMAIEECRAIAAMERLRKQAQEQHRSRFGVRLVDA
jgi:hypothetical protein